MSYQAIIPFFQQYNQMLYGFLNREYDTVLQTQDEVFFQNNQREMKGLMKKYYGNRYRFLMVYEVVSVIRRKKQIMYQYFAIVLITMLLSQIDGKYIEYVLLFSILILGQNVVSYNVQNELRLVKKGFPLRYSLKEKLQCKSVIGMFLLLLPMLCYWIAYKIELFSILLWIWMPIQSIIIYTAKNRLQRLLYILPFYILSVGGNHVVRADRSPTYSMVCIMIGAIINTILDPLFIFGFGWGIKGAAWATVIGQVASGVLVIVYFCKFRKMYLSGGMLKPNRHHRH